MLTLRLRAGYQVVYLSGRQGSFYNLTLQWLIKHNFPPGPIHLTRTHKPTLPVYASVGNFKVKYMQNLKQKGFELYAAYGNTVRSLLQCY
jgi:phosphatidate phosphatase APP1